MHLSLRRRQRSNWPCPCREAPAQSLGQPTLTALAATIIVKRKSYYEALEAANKQNEITVWPAPCDFRRGERTRRSYFKRGGEQLPRLGTGAALGHESLALTFCLATRRCMNLRRSLYRSSTSLRRHGKNQHGQDCQDEACNQRKKMVMRMGPKIPIAGPAKMRQGLHDQPPVTIKQQTRFSVSL